MDQIKSIEDCDWPTTAKYWGGRTWICKAQFEPKLYFNRMKTIFFPSWQNNISFYTWEGLGKLSRENFFRYCKIKTVYLFLFCFACPTILNSKAFAAKANKEGSKINRLCCTLWHFNLLSFVSLIFSSKTSFSWKNCWNYCSTKVDKPLVSTNSKI